jgi:hypothetical protein
MSFQPVPLGCVKASTRPDASDRHWGHWRWLNHLPQSRYVRAIALWHNVFHKRPRGIQIDCHGVRLYMEDC